ILWQAPQLYPSDYRVVRDSCGACHIEVIEAAERSLMATGAMLWGGAAYNNGVLPYKNYVIGEAYTHEGEPAHISSPLGEAGLTAQQRARGVLGDLYPIPTWHVVPPADVFRVFERGGRNIGTQFSEIGLPNPTGSLVAPVASRRQDQVRVGEETGGENAGTLANGTGNGVDGAAPAEGQARAQGNAPADANHASVGESGHPLRHVFTRAIPTAQ